MRQLPVQQALQVAFGLVCTATLAYYATGVDWFYAYESKSLPGAIFTFFLFSLLGLAPYALLWHLLHMNFRNWLKPLAFALVVAPAPILFAAWRNAEGWSFFLVPAVQLFVALALVSLVAQLKQHPRVPT